MKLPFTKMQGCANDYIYLDCRESGVRSRSQSCPAGCPSGIFPLVRTASSASAPGRRLVPMARCGCSTPTAARGRCRGNGIRCVAQWLRTHAPECAALDELRIDTRSGLKTLRWQGEGMWQVEMGQYSLLPADLPAVQMGEAELVDVPLSAAGKTWQVSCISVGNPHCVTIVPDVDALILEKLGPAFEKHPNFPQQINTEFVQLVDPTHIKMRVSERGSGETWACGTGACAVAAALTERGLCPAGQPLHIALRGGELRIQVLPDRQGLADGPARPLRSARVWPRYKAAAIP